MAARTPDDISRAEQVANTMNLPAGPIRTNFEAIGSGTIFGQPVSEAVIRGAMVHGALHVMHLAATGGRITRHTPRSVEQAIGNEMTRAETDPAHLRELVHGFQVRWLGPAVAMGTSSASPQQAHEGAIMAAVMLTNDVARVNANRQQRRGGLLSGRMITTGPGGTSPEIAQQITAMAARLESGRENPSASDAMPDQPSKGRFFRPRER